MKRKDETKKIADQDEKKVETQNNKATLKFDPTIVQAETKNKQGFVIIILVFQSHSVMV